MGRWFVAALALFAALWSTNELLRSTDGLIIEHYESGPIPISVFRPDTQTPGPLVVVVHGFAGSRPMMQQFAVSLAQNGYLAATFDLSGHGRNRVPLTGDLQSIDGATQVLVNDIGVVVDAVRKRYETLPEGMAVVGHSMASDLVVRYAQRDDSVMATVGVAMFSPAVTAISPRNLLVINGEWEPRLNEAGYDVLRQVTDETEPSENVTYGSFETGTARRMVEADNTEHVGVLFSVESATATVSWLNQVFTGNDAISHEPVTRGRWIILLVIGIVGLWWSLAPLLPVVSFTDDKSGMSTLNTSLVIFIPMMATPLLLSLVNISFLPVLVGDYLAVHLALYGLLTFLLTLFFRRRNNVLSSPVDKPRFLTSLLIVVLFSLPLGAALNWQVASFIPTVERLPLLLAIGIGTLCWFVTDEWATRTSTTWRWAYPLSKVAFLLSLAIAVALDFEGLFFLLLIVPIMVPILIVFGLLSRWVYRSTGSALVAGVGNALFLAWAIAVTFPWVGAS